MQSLMNLKIKFRESFRPFAPAVLEEHAAEYFELRPGAEEPLHAAGRRCSHASVCSDEQIARPCAGSNELKASRSTMPAVTHVDYSARVQTVDAQRHGRFRLLLEPFHAKTGCPCLINTSFNVRGEPIVCTPADAYRCFQATEMDVLVLGRCVLNKPDAGTGGSNTCR